MCTGPCSLESRHSYVTSDCICYSAMHAGFLVLLLSLQEVKVVSASAPHQDPLGWRRWLSRKWALLSWLLQQQHDTCSSMDGSGLSYWLADITLSLA